MSHRQYAEPPSCCDDDTNQCACPQARQPKGYTALSDAADGPQANGNGYASELPAWMPRRAKAHTAAGADGHAALADRDTDPEAGFRDTCVCNPSQWAQNG
jgi:hypothetical protein